MKKVFLILAFLIALTASAYSTDIDVGASSITGFNTSNAGVDTALSNVSVTLGSPNVTCSNCLPTGAVGLSGIKVTFSTGVTYTIATAASRSAFTLTVNYAESTGTVTGTLHKFVHLRIYVMSPFVPAGSTTVVQSGSQGTTAWYRRYGVSIINDGAQNVAHVPPINDLPATTDSSNPTARYFAALYTQGGGFMQGYPGCVDDFRLSHETTPTSWAQICSFNSVPPTPPSQPLNFYTAAQIDARFPSCLINNLVYFGVTGNVQSCLTLSGEFSIAGGVLSLAAPATGYNRIQEEGVDLPQRATLNFIGSSFTAADEVGVRTNVTADADLNAIASLTGTGIARRTGVDTWQLATDVVTGPASATDNAVARFDLTTGKILQNSAVTVADTTGNFAVPDGWAVTNATGSSSTFNARSFAFNIPSTSVANTAFSAVIAQGQVNAAGRGLHLNTTYTATGTSSSDDILLQRLDTSVGSGQQNFIRGAIGGGPSTMFRIASTGSYFFGNVAAFIGDTNGNELIKFTHAASAVNEITVTNGGAGAAPLITASGDDANISIALESKGIGSVFLKTNGIDRAVIAGIDANAYFGDGIVSATPDNYVINATGGSGTNIAGAHLDLAGGKGTGNAAPGVTAVRYPLIGASGTTLQSLSTERFPVATSLYTNTTVGNAVTNTTTETSVFTGATASSGSTLTIQGGLTRAGTVYRLKMYGLFSTTGTPTIRWRIKLGSTTVADSTAFTSPNNAAGEFFIEANIYVNAIGASGTTRCDMEGRLTVAITGAVTPTFFLGDAGAPTTDFTANQTIDVTAQWGAAAAGNSITMINTVIERIR